MRARAWHPWVAGALVTTAVTGCAGKRIENGVFHSPKGYRVAMPGGEWTVRNESGADLELHHRAASSGMLVNAACGPGPSRGGLDVLERHLLLGLRERSITAEEEISLNGTRARHAVLEGRFGGDGELVKVELYVMRDDRCVYDLVYAAPPVDFDRWRGEFKALVDTFSLE